MLDSLTLLLIVAPVSASQPTQTYVLQPAGPWETWTPAAISLAQFLVLAYISWHVFVDGSRQKVAEREAIWYHKIVVDHSIGSMARFFDEATKLLCLCCTDLQMLINSKAESEYDKRISRALAEFKESLTAMRNDISGRIRFFDERTKTAFLQRADQLEDEITLWFDTYKRANAYDHRDSLPHVLNSCQIELLGIIKQYEFNEWGWPRGHQKPDRRK